MKRGFTLIEVIAVITILGIIGVIAVIAVDKTIKDNNQRLYEMQISNIEDAARTWGSKNIKYLPDNLDEAISIPLIVLKKDGLVDKEIKNPKTGELFLNDMYIDITYKNGIYNYDVLEDSGTNSANDLDVPTIIFKNTLNQEISVGEEMNTDAIILLKNGDTIDFKSAGSYATVNTNLNNNVVGEYSYSVAVKDGTTFTATRKITVK